MNVIECDDSHRDAWDAYVHASPAASFYHLYGWRGINAEEFGHRSVYLAATEDGRIVGVFPIVLVKSRLFGNLACSMPFVNFGGPVRRHRGRGGGAPRRGGALRRRVSGSPISRCGTGDGLAQTCRRRSTRSA